jgi:hypothetical protein
LGVACGPSHPLQVLASLHFVSLRSGLSAHVSNAAAPTNIPFYHFLLLESVNLSEIGAFLFAKIVLLVTKAHLHLRKWFPHCRRRIYICENGFYTVEGAFTFAKMVSTL